MRRRIHAYEVEEDTSHMRRRIHAHTVANVLALSRRKRRGIPASQDRIAMYTPDL
jgi:hypothetical protein